MRKTGKFASLIYIFGCSTLRMIESGLLVKWKDEFQPKPKHCLDPPGYKQQIEEMRRPMEIKLIYMKGAFFFLFLGFGVSFSWFLIEQLFYKIDSNNTNIV